MDGILVAKKLELGKQRKLKRRINSDERVARINNGLKLVSAEVRL